MSTYGGGPENSDLAVRLTLESDSQLDPEEYEKVTRQLRAELKDLDVESVRLVATDTAPVGAKGDPVTIGTLVVALSASGGVFTTLIAVLHDWLRRHSGNSLQMAGMMMLRRASKASRLGRCRKEPTKRMAGPAVSRGWG